MKKFWEFKAKNNTGELFLYGEIAESSWWGDEVTPAQFQRELAALGDIGELKVYINSPGGDAFAGIAIYNILKRHAAKKTVHVDGLAASAASVIAMAADVLIIPRSATLMIHNAWTCACGGSEDLRAMADELDRINSQMSEIYAERSGMAQEDVAALMQAETWMSGTEALEKGLCDETDEAIPVAACADAGFFARYLHPPAVDVTAESNEALNRRISLREKIMQGGF